MLATFLIKLFSYTNNEVLVLHTIIVYFLPITFLSKSVSIGMIYFHCILLLNPCGVHILS